MAAITGGVLLGASALGAGANIYAGNKAAKATKQGSQQASDTTLRMFEQNRADQAPYRQVGTGALNKLASLYGIEEYREPEPFNGPLVATPQPVRSSQSNKFIPRIIQGGGGGSGKFSSGLSGAQKLSLVGNVAYGGRPASGAQAFEYSPGPVATPIPRSRQPVSSRPDYSDFYSSPDYQFALQEGERVVNRNLARQGLTGSGEALKELTRFSQGLATQNLGNYKNSLAALAGIGQTSTNQTAALGANAAANVAGYQQRGADARASSYLNTGSAIAGLGNAAIDFSLLKSAGLLG